MGAAALAFAAEKPATDNARVTAALAPEAGRLVVDVHGVPPAAPVFFSATVEHVVRLSQTGIATTAYFGPEVELRPGLVFETEPDDRARWSKRNFYRFLDRFRDRWDLVLSGEPEHH